MSEYIGLVFDLGTNELRMVIDPDVDDLLDDPAHVNCNNEKRIMVKVPRSEHRFFVKGKVSPLSVNHISKNINKYLERNYDEI